MDSHVIYKNIQEAFSIPHWKDTVYIYKKAVVFEKIKALIKNDIRDLVPITKRIKLVGCRWVLPLSITQMKRLTDSKQD